MNIDLFSFFVGGAVFLVGFLAIMAWIVPDKAASRAMTWLTSRKNFSRIGLVLGVIALLIFVVVMAIAFIKLLQYVQVDTWVWVVAIAGLAFVLISVLVLLITRQKSVS
jgi:hypothetical protein